jgi:hypothetical protein
MFCDSGIFGAPRSRTENEMRGGESENLIQVDLIVPLDQNIGAKFEEVLYEVVGKAIVIVENKNHVKTPGERFQDPI